MNLKNSQHLKIIFVHVLDENILDFVKNMDCFSWIDPCFYLKLRVYAEVIWIICFQSPLLDLKSIFRYKKYEEGFEEYDLQI